MIIMFDGPEKAGKSTIIGMVKSKVGLDKVRPWGVVPSDDVYREPLIADAQANKWIAWDRGWASEHVYGKLLGRDRRLVSDPWLGEWLYGRIAAAAGVKIMLLPKRVEDSASRRDQTDLPVDPTAECHAFEDYAIRFGWHILYNEYTERSDEVNVNKIQRLMTEAEYGGPLRYPYWLGPRDASVVFMTGTPSNIMPFYGSLTRQLAREFGDTALKCAWVSTGHPKELLEYRTVVLVGDQRSNLHLTNNADVLYINVLNDHKEVTTLVNKIKEIV